MLAEALSIVQAIVGPPGAWIVTSATQAAGLAGKRRRLCDHAGLHGLARAARQEAPALHLWSIDLEESSASLKRCYCAQSQSSQSSVPSGQCHGCLERR